MKEGITSSPYGSYDQGYYMCYNGYYNDLQISNDTSISKKYPQFGLETENRLHEVRFISNRKLECFGEIITPVRTNCPSLG